MTNQKETAVIPLKMISRHYMYIPFQFTHQSALCGTHKHCNVCKDFCNITNIAWNITDCSNTCIINIGRNITPALERMCRSASQRWGLGEPMS